MNLKEIDKLWHKAMHTAIEKGELFTRFEFANLIEKHLIASGYRRCAEGQRTTQYCAMVEEAVKEEREACAKVCDEIWAKWTCCDPADEAGRCAAAIRARSET